MQAVIERRLYCRCFKKRLQVETG